MTQRPRLKPIVGNMREDTFKGKIPPRKKKLRFKKNPIRKMVALIDGSNNTILLVKGSKKSNANHIQQLFLPGHHQPGNLQRSEEVLERQVMKLTGCKVQIERTLSVRSFAYRSFTIFEAKLLSNCPTNEKVVWANKTEILKLTTEDGCIIHNGTQYIIPNFVREVVLMVNRAPTNTNVITITHDK